MTRTAAAVARLLGNTEHPAPWCVHHPARPRQGSAA